MKFRKNVQLFSRTRYNDNHITIVWYVDEDTVPTNLKTNELGRLLTDVAHEGSFKMRDRIRRLPWWRRLFNQF